MALDFRQQLTGLVEKHFTQLVIDAISAAIVARGGLDQRAMHTQRRQAGARHVDEGLAIRQWVRHPPLQVAFGSAQGLGQVRQLIGWRLHLQVLQPTLHIAGATGKQLGHGRQHQHRQRTANLLQQPWQGLQALPRPAGLQAIADQVLGLLQHVQRLVQHQLADLGQVRARQAALAVFLQRADHAIERGLHVKQGPRYIHQHRVVHGPLALGQGLQRQHLVDDHPAWLLEAQHRQGVGHVAQRCQQGIELLAVLAVTAYELVQALLDAHQVVAQRGHHRAQGIAARPGLQLLAPVAQRQVEVGQVVGTGKTLGGAADQAGLGQWLLATAGTQLVEQRQHHQWQVVAGAAQAFQI
ncbi:hypothetical protein D3C76_973370 [compost metagenome]